MSDQEKAATVGQGLREVIPFLRDADRLFDHLERQAALVEEAARLFAHPTDDQAASLERIEEEETRLSNEIEQYLQHAYALKIDRDVLYETSSHLDGILSGILRSVQVRRTSSEITGTTAVATQWRATLAARILQLVERITRGVGGLRNNDHVVIAQVARELRDEGRETSRTYDAALAALLEANAGSVEDGPTLTREAFALEDLKHIVKSCAATGEYLANVAVKLS